jgi:hypothetical protein
MRSSIGSRHRNPTKEQQEEDGVINKHMLYEALLYLAFVERNLGIYRGLEFFKLKNEVKAYCSIGKRMTL